MFQDKENKQGFFNAHSRRRLSLSILFLFLQMALTFKKHLKMYSNFVGFSLISFSFHSFSKNSSIDTYKQQIFKQLYIKIIQNTCFLVLWVDITISVKNNQNLANENTVCIYQHSIFIQSQYKQLFSFSVSYFFTFC